MSCASCGSDKISDKEEPEIFLYGSGPNPAKIHVTVTVTTCADCCMSYTDSRAEEIRDGAVRRYLAVLARSNKSGS